MCRRNKNFYNKNKIKRISFPMAALRCKNTFVTFCWCKNAVFFALQKTKMLPLHFVGAKMLCFLLCKKQRCCAKMHFCITFCWCKNAVFFALQKTKMRTFCFAEHFPLENVQQNKMLQMHLMQKCI